MSESNHNEKEYKRVVLLRNITQIFIAIILFISAFAFKNNDEILKGVSKIFLWQTIGLFMVLIALSMSFGFCLGYFFKKGKD